MNIAEFCRGRNVDPQAVRKYIMRHSKEFEGIVEKKGREIDLTIFAVEKLDKKYPYVKPVQVLEGVEPAKYAETLEMVARLQNEIRGLEAEKVKYKEMIQKLEVDVFLLEDKRREGEELNKELKDRIEEGERMRLDQERQIGALENDKKTLEDALAEERERRLTFRERLFGKKG